MRTRHLVLLVLAFRVMLGTLYSIAVPIWEAYDEWGHYPYVRYIAENRALPPRDKRLVPYNDTVRSQPPLYYALGAAATFWIDTSDWRDPIENRYSSLPTAMGGYNRALHPYDEDFPWRGWVLAVHVVRFVSVILSTVTVWLTYQIGKTLFPGRPAVALGGMAIAAFWPQFLFIGGVVNNDNLVTAFAAVVLLFMVRSVVGPPRWADRVGLVLGMGGAVAAKVVGIAFLPVGLYGLAWSFGKGLSRAGGRRSLWVVLSLVLASALLTGVAVLSHPRYLALAQHYLQPPTSPTDIPLHGWLEIGRVMWGTLWASFGWQSVGIAGWVYDVVQPVWLLALLGLAWYFVWGRERQVKWALAGLLAAVALVASMILYRGLFEAYYFTGRYLLSTTAAFSTLLAVGLAALTPQRWNRYVLGAVAAGMLAFAAYAPFAYIVPVYARPKKLSLEAVEPLKNPLHVVFDHKIELLGYEVLPTTFYPGQTIRVDLYWHCLEEMGENYTLGLKLLGRGGEEIAGLNVHPGRGNYPTSMWRGGDVFQDTYWLPVAGDATPLTMARLKAAFFLDRADLEHLPVFDAQEQPLGFAVFFGRLKVAPVEKPAYSPRRATDYRVDDLGRLVGWDLPERVRAGESLGFTLYWEASGATERPYTVFVHVRDQEGRVVAQADGQPLDGEYPTDLWDPGEVIPDTHVVPGVADLPAGTYFIVTGLYSVESGARLPVWDAGGDPLPLAEIPLGSFGIDRQRRM